MTALLAFLGSAVVKSILDKVLFFLALKLLLTALFVVALPIVLNNLIYGFMETSINYLSVHADGVNAYSGALEATGIMAWIVECFKLPECFSILISAFQLHLILKLLPFSPVK